MSKTFFWLDFNSIWDDQSVTAQRGPGVTTFRDDPLSLISEKKTLPWLRTPTFFRRPHKSKNHKLQISHHPTIYFLFLCCTDQWPSMSSLWRLSIWYFVGPGCAYQAGHAEGGNIENVRADKKARCPDEDIRMMSRKESEILEYNATARKYESIVTLWFNTWTLDSIKSGRRLQTYKDAIAEFLRALVTCQNNETHPHSHASSVLGDPPQADIALVYDETDNIHSKLRSLLITRSNRFV